MRFLQAIERLRWPLAMLLGATALALAAGFVRLQDERRIERLRDDIRAMQSRLQEQMARERLGRRMQGPYERLVKAGFLDPASVRPLWIQSLARALDRAHVLKGGLAMHPAIAVREARLEALGYRLTMQSVTVDMQLAHEGDLAAFLEQVLGRPVGIVKNRFCSVASVMEQDIPSSDRPNLQARCRLDWYAIEPAPEAADGEGLDAPGEPL